MKTLKFLGIIFVGIFLILILLELFNKPELTHGDRLSVLATEQCNPNVAYTFGQDSFETPTQAFLFFSIAIMRSYATMLNEEGFEFREKAREARYQASSILEEDVPRKLQKQARAWYLHNCPALGE